MGQESSVPLMKAKREEINAILQNPNFPGRAVDILFNDAELQRTISLVDDETGVAIAGDEELDAFRLSPELREEALRQCRRGRATVDAGMPKADDPLARMRLQLEATVPAVPGHEAAFERRAAFLQGLMELYNEQRRGSLAEGGASASPPEGLAAGSLGLYYGIQTESGLQRLVGPFLQGLSALADRINGGGPDAVQALRDLNQHLEKESATMALFEAWAAVPMPDPSRVAFAPDKAKASSSSSRVSQPGRALQGRVWESERNSSKSFWEVRDDESGAGMTPVSVKIRCSMRLLPKSLRVSLQGRDGVVRAVATVSGEALAAGTGSVDVEVGKHIAKLGLSGVRLDFDGHHGQCNAHGLLACDVLAVPESADGLLAADAAGRPPVPIKRTHAGGVLMKLRGALARIIDGSRMQYAGVSSAYPVLNPGAVVQAASAGIEQPPVPSSTYEVTNPDNAHVKVVSRAVEALLRLALASGSCSCLLQALRAMLPDSAAAQAELPSKQIRLLLAKACVEAASWIKPQGERAHFQKLIQHRAALRSIQRGVSLGGAAADGTGGLSRLEDSDAVPVDGAQDALGDAAIESVGVQNIQPRVAWFGGHHQTHSFHPTSSVNIARSSNDLQVTSQTEDAMGIIPHAITSKVSCFSFKLARSPAAKHVSIGIVALPFHGPIAFNKCESSWVIRSRDGVVYRATEPVSALGEHPFGGDSTVTVVVVLADTSKPQSGQVYFAVDKSQLIGPIDANCESDQKLYPAATFDGIGAQVRYNDDMIHFKSIQDFNSFVASRHQHDHLISSTRGPAICNSEAPRILNFGNPNDAPDIRSLRVRVDAAHWPDAPNDFFGRLSFEHVLRRSSPGAASLTESSEQGTLEAFIGQQRDCRIIDEYISNMRDEARAREVMERAVAETTPSGPASSSSGAAPIGSFDEWIAAKLTASGGGAASGPWQCASCTFQNSEADMQCQMCSNPKPSGLNVLQEQAGWTCAACTYQNKPGTATCEMCTQARTMLDEAAFREQLRVQYEQERAAAQSAPAPAPAPGAPATSHGPTAADVTLQHHRDLSAAVELQNQELLKPMPSTRGDAIVAVLGVINALLQHSFSVTLPGATGCAAPAAAPLCAEPSSHCLLEAFALLGCMLPASRGTLTKTGAQAAAQIGDLILGNVEWLRHANIHPYAVGLGDWPSATNALQLVPAVLLGNASMFAFALAGIDSRSGALIDTVPPGTDADPCGKMALRLLEAKDSPVLGPIVHNMRLAGCKFVTSGAMPSFVSLEIKVGFFRRLIRMLSTGEIKPRSREGAALGGFLQSLANIEAVHGLASDFGAIQALMEWQHDSFENEISAGTTGSNSVHGQVSATLGAVAFSLGHGALAQLQSMQARSDVDKLERLVAEFQSVASVSAGGGPVELGSNGAGASESKESGSEERGLGTVIEPASRLPSDDLRPLLQAPFRDWLQFSNLVYGCSVRFVASGRRAIGLGANQDAVAKALGASIVCSLLPMVAIGNTVLLQGFPSVAARIVPKLCSAALELDKLCSSLPELQDAARGNMRRMVDAANTMNSSSSMNDTAPRETIAVDGASIADEAAASSKRVSVSSAATQSQADIVAVLQLHGGAIQDKSPAQAGAVLAGRLAQEQGEIDDIPGLGIADVSRMRPGMLEDVQRGVPRLLAVAGTLTIAASKISMMVSQGLGEEEEEEAIGALLSDPVLRHGIDPLVGDGFDSFGVQASKTEVADDVCAAMQAARLAADCQVESLPSWDTQWRLGQSDDLALEDWGKVVRAFRKATVGGPLLAAGKDFKSTPALAAGMRPDLWWRECFCKALAVKVAASDSPVGKLGMSESVGARADASKRLSVLLFDHYDSVLGDSAASVRDKGKRSLPEESLFFAALLRMTGAWKEALRTACSLLGVVAPTVVMSVSEDCATSPSSDIKTVYEELCLARARIRQTLRDQKAQAAQFLPSTAVGGALIPLPSTEEQAMYAAGASAEASHYQKVSGYFQGGSESVDGPGASGPASGAGAADPLAPPTLHREESSLLDSRERRVPRASVPNSGSQVKASFRARGRLLLSLLPGTDVSAPWLADIAIGRPASAAAATGADAAGFCPALVGMASQGRLEYQAWTGTLPAEQIKSICKSAGHYFESGFGAHPMVLRAIMKRRAVRAAQRAFGLAALGTLALGSKLLLSKVLALRHVPGAFKTKKLYFEHVGKELRAMQALGHSSTQMGRMQIDSNTSQRHHSVAIQGAPAPLAVRAKLASFFLLDGLASTISEASATSSPMALQAVVNAAAMEFLPEDAAFLARSNFLRNLFRAGTILRGEPAVSTSLSLPFMAAASGAGAAGANPAVQLLTGQISKADFLRQQAGAGIDAAIDEIASVHTRLSLIAAVSQLAALPTPAAKHGFLLASTSASRSGLVVPAMLVDSKYDSTVRQADLLKEQHGWMLGLNSLPADPSKMSAQREVRSISMDLLHFFAVQSIRSSAAGAEKVMHASMMHDLGQAAAQMMLGDLRGCISVFTQEIRRDGAAPKKRLEAGGDPLRPTSLQLDHAEEHAYECMQNLSVLIAEGISLSWLAAEGSSILFKYLLVGSLRIRRIALHLVESTIEAVGLEKANTLTFDACKEVELFASARDPTAVFGMDAPAAIDPANVWSDAANCGSPPQSFLGLMFRIASFQYCQTPNRLSQEVAGRGPGHTHTEVHGVGAGYCRAALGSDVIAMLRRLCCSSQLELANSARVATMGAIRRAAALIDRQGVPADDSSGQARLCQASMFSPADGTASAAGGILEIEKYRAIVAVACAAFCVVGGDAEVLRVGGRIGLRGSGVIQHALGLAAAALGSDAEASSGSSVADAAKQQLARLLHEVPGEATVIEYRFGSKTVGVVFDSERDAALQQARGASAQGPGVAQGGASYSAVTVEQLSVTDVLPVSSAHAPVDAFPLEPSLVEAFRSLVASEDRDLGVGKLWRHQLRSKAVQALQAIVTQPKVASTILDSGLLGSLVSTALDPIGLPGFVEMTWLQYRGRQLKMWLIDAATGVQLAGQRGYARSSSSAKTKEEMDRETVARELQSITQCELPVAIKALELHQDKMDEAANWLFAGGAATFVEGGGMQEAQSGDDSDPRLNIAREMGQISGLPPRLCYRALEMFQDNRDAAATWVMEEGVKYQKDPELKDESSGGSSDESIRSSAVAAVRGAHRKKTSGAVRDPRSALEAAGLSGGPTAGAGSGGSASGEDGEDDVADPALVDRLFQQIIAGGGSRRQGMIEHLRMLSAAGSGGRGMGAAIRSVIRRLEAEGGAAAGGASGATDGRGGAQDQSGQDRSSTATESSAMGGYETMLDSITIAAGAAAGAHIHNGTPVVALCRPGSRDDGRRLLLAGLGPIGTVIRDTARRNMLGVRFLDPLSGTARCVPIPVGMLRSMESMYGTSLATPESVSDLCADTEQSIATRSARRAVLSLLLNWPSTVVLSTNQLGGPAQMVCLTRFIAASEHALEQASAIFNGDDAQVEDTQPSPLLFVVESTLRRLIKAEQLTGTTATLHRDSSRLQSAAALLRRSLASQLAQSGAGGAAATGLADTLLDDCAWNVRESTKPADFEDARVVESLHPYFQRCDYPGEVVIEGARGIVVGFDPATSLGAGAQLRLFGPKGQVIRKIDSSTAVSEIGEITIQSDRVAYRFTARPEGSDAERSFGFRFVVAPLRGMQWLSERSVLQDASLEWAAWLLRFLAQGKGAGTAQAVHSSVIVGALVDYLQTQGAPFKENIVSLLSQLLSDPGAFPRDSPPPFPAFDAISAGVVRECEKLRAESAIQVPPKLQALVQMCVLAQRARRIVDSGSKEPPARPVNVNEDFTRSGLFGMGDLVLKVPVAAFQAAKASSLGLLQQLVDVYDMVSCLHSNSRMPDHITSTVVAHYASTTTTPMAIERVSSKDFATIVMAQGTWAPPMDEQLVRYASQLAQGKSKSMIELSPPEFVVKPEMKERYPLIGDMNEKDVRARFVLLQELNRRLAQCIEFVDMSESGSSSSGGSDAHSAWSIGSRLRHMSHAIFPDAKARLVEAVIEGSFVDRQKNFGLELDNTKAFQMQDAGIVDPSMNQGVFVQAFEQLDRVRGVHFRQKLDHRDRLFEVSYKGEDGLDWGGLFRESLTRIIEDVFSKNLNLLVPCPNSRTGKGMNLDKFVPNPTHTSPRLLRMFHFLGRVLGISMRFKMSLPAQLPSIVWKYLTSEAVNVEDVDAIDETTGAFLKELVSDAKAASGRSAEEAAAAAALAAATGSSADAAASGAGGVADASKSRFFSVRSILGEDVDLIPGGSTQGVKPEDLPRYARLAVHYKTHELDRQLYSLRQGFVEVVPLRVLRLCRWNELEAYVCGDPNIDVEELKKHTTYHGYDKNDKACKMFWRVFPTLSEEERSKFIRFAWGRSRLPRGKWTKPFKFTKRNGGDDQLPIGHTCFFQVEMPAYSSDKVMRKSILTAINWGMDAFLIA